jgi:hypothetical protein
MNDSHVIPEKTPPRLSSLLWALGLVLLVSAAAINTQSFWIDECGVAYKAAMPHLSEFWHKISTEGSADLQQPFHHFFAWGWEKLVGINEVAFRSGNIPFLLLGIGSLACAFARVQSVLRGIMVVLLTSPFVWYYLNEARPYSVQIGASLMVFSSIYRLSLNSDQSSERKWVLWLCFGMVLLATSGMLAMLWLGAYLMSILLSTPVQRLRELLKMYAVACGITTLLLLAMGLFYLWTLGIGARATSVGGTDLRNLAFIPYELLGFSGLGPGRLSIRNEGLSAFRPYLPGLVVFGLFAGGVFARGCACLARRLAVRTLWAWPLSFLLVGGFIMGVGVAVHFRVLGRHCTPVLPLIGFILGSGLVSLWNSPRVALKAVAVLFTAVSLTSCLGVRFGSQHAKDDYRAAARYAQTTAEQGKRVWWNADREGAAIYGLATVTNAEPGVLWVANPAPGFDTGLPRPDVVITSKPDIYDGFGALSEFLKREAYIRGPSFVAFMVWERPKESLQPGRVE